MEQPAASVFPPHFSSPFTTIHSVLHFCNKGRSQGSWQICSSLSCREDAQDAHRALSLTSYKVLGKFLLPWCYPATPAASCFHPTAPVQAKSCIWRSRAWSSWGQWQQGCLRGLVFSTGGQGLHLARRQTLSFHYHYWAQLRTITHRCSRKDPSAIAC